MDTLKDKQYLDGLAAEGNPPWRNRPTTDSVRALQP